MKVITKYFLLILVITSPLFSNQSTIINLANNSKLYNSNRWKALLHYDDKLYIKDKRFILSNNFSLKNELDATIKSFYAPKENYPNINNHPQCRFPARFLFITHELNISKDEFPKINCPAFNIYNLKAPADKISLVYASENVKNPTSMMGHTFLKFSGINYQNRKVNHAITFYTVIQSQNPLTLLYQNIFSGMKGMFALQPYRIILTQYTQRENRNVWEYQLKLSNYQKKLIYYHVWELKDVKMKYFFTSYNCSTVIYYALSLANPKIYNDRKLWISPLNTVKYLYKYNLFQKATLIPSDEWLVKMIEENSNQNSINKVKEIVNNKKYEDINNLNFYSLKLLSAYTNLLYNNKKIDKITKNKIEKKVDEKLEKSDKIFDISHYKSPNKIPPERQFELGYARINNNNYIKLSFLPASHLLNDNNREYFGESELKIGYLSILANDSNIELNDFTLYGMKSYIPYDTLTNDLSYQFELALKKDYTKSFDYKNSLKIDGGMGIDFLIAKDINLFFMLNGGIGYNTKEQTHLFFNPEIGGMIYEIFNMKTFISYQSLFIGTTKIYNKYTLKHNIFLNQNWTFSANIEKIKGKKDYTNYEFSLKYLF
jgi:hypothetical protein